MKVLWLQGRVSERFAEATVRTVETGRSLRKGPLQQQDGVLVETATFPVGPLFQLLFEMVGDAFQRNVDIQPRRASKRMRRTQETPTFENGTGPSSAAMMCYTY